MQQVVGFHIFSEVPVTVHSLGFRKINAGMEFHRRMFEVRAGDIELGFEDVYGTSSSIIARSAQIEFLPNKDLK